MEVSTEFEGNHFVLDKLGPGTAINYRSFFIKDQMYVDMKALTEVKILKLPLTVLMELVNKHGAISPNDKTERDKQERKERI